MRLASMLVAAFGCALSAFYLFDRAWLVGICVFVASTTLLSTLFKLDRFYLHPSVIALGFEASKEVSLDGYPYRLEAIWASPILLILVVIELEVETGKRVRLLLGRDTLSDEQWSEVQTWRVWCQRG
jgi:hypothetical protein